MVGVVQLGLEHLQVANLEAGGGEGNLEVHRDWRPRKGNIYILVFVGLPCPLLLGLSLQQLNLCGDLRLLHAAHPLDLPHDGVLAGLVLGLALHADQLHPAGVEGRGDPDLQLLGQQAGLEVGLDDDLDLELGPAHLPHQGDHPEGQRDVLGRPVPGGVVVRGLSRWPTM